MYIFLNIILFFKNINNCTLYFLNLKLKFMQLQFFGDNQHTAKAFVGDQAS